MLELGKIKEFLQDGTHPRTPTPMDQHVLKGYQKNTLISYNTAVKKLCKSTEAAGEKDFTLPLTPDGIYQFCYWASREEGNEAKQDVTLKTLE
ncbi:hypothetical protein PCANC_18025 [Puccinia coronata f. sp. avenae]|uniref:Uncharacterized protein n=1 Tax=Puccinia coronata f. sp. avenae TaxID=200324 RepID=A0A2N5SJ47_9BASI|nr:hypothetical protein PCANC_18025 [Puccinia coronata f. sp. avenae]